MIALFASTRLFKLEEEGVERVRVIRLSDFGKSQVLYSADGGSESRALAAVYKTQVTKSTSQQVVEKTPAYEHLIKIAGRNAFSLIYRHFVAAQFETMPNGDLQATAMYNQQAISTDTISLKFIDNAILRQYVGEQYAINTLPFRLSCDMMSYGYVDSECIHEHDTQGYPTDFYVMLHRTMFASIGYMMPIVLASCMLPVVSERVDGMKNMMLMTGLHPAMMWVATFAIDISIYTVTIVLMIALMKFIEYPAFSGIGISVNLFVILFTYGCAELSLVYLMSLMFQSPAAGFIFAAMISMILGRTRIRVFFLAANT